MSGRLHEAVITATIGAHPDPHREPHWHDLYLSTVGWWRQQVREGQVVQTGDTLGELTVLGVNHRVIAGPGVRGAVMDAPPREGAKAAGPGWPIMTIDSGAMLRAAATELDETAAAAATSALTVRAPSSGRFYGRPGPGKPAFVSVGDVIREGHTLCLLEVMKTFHRVTYGGSGLPAEARVVSIAVADEADVNAGDSLVHVEAV